MASLALFFELENFNFLSKFNKFKEKNAEMIKAPKPVVYLIGIYVIFQLAMPLRHYFIPGNVDWTGEGHRFAWRMKIQTRAINKCEFAIFDLDTKTIYPVKIDNHIHDIQKYFMVHYPKMILDFAHYLKKYAKKELKKGIKLVAIKITNNSVKDLTFGKDAILTYGDGSEIYIMENERVFSKLKQSPASYLWYLLLTPMNFYTTKTNSNGFQENTSSTPIGLVVGPGLAGGNMIAAGSANKKFKTEMLDYNINGTIIKKGETKYGLIGIKSNSFDSLKLKVN